MQAEMYFFFQSVWLLGMQAQHFPLPLNRNVFHNVFRLSVLCFNEQISYCIESFWLWIFSVLEVSVGLDVERQVTESSVNKTLTEFKPGLYTQPIWCLICIVEPHIDLH